MQADKQANQTGHTGTTVCWDRSCRTSPSHNTALQRPLLPKLTVTTLTLMFLFMFKQGQLPCMLLVKHPDGVRFLIAVQAFENVYSRLLVYLLETLRALGVPKGLQGWIDSGEAMSHHYSTLQTSKG